jgi:hypothetical protein
VVLVPIAMPWGYVFKHYLKVPGARWGKKQVSAVASEPTNPDDDGVSTGVEQPAAVPTNGSARSEPRMKLQRERPGRGPHGF